MPITVFDLEMDETNLRPGFDLGATSGEDHIVFNHLAFNVLIHKAHDAHANAVKDPRRGPQVGPRGVWEVVGLEVMPCSIQRASGEPLEQIPCKPWGSRHNPPPQIVAEGEDIVYTYDVYWEEVSQPWSGRWGLYIGDATLTRLVAMLNPLAMLAAVCVVLALLCRRVAGRDLAPPETTPLPAKEEDRRRWKLVAGDVFRSPPATAALAVCVGTGVQLLCATLATLLLAAFGAFPDGHSSALPIAALTLHSCCTAVGGAAAVALLRSTQHAAAAWAPVCIKTACYFPGAAFAAFAAVNTLVATTGSSMAAPPSLYLLLAALVLVGVPLSLAGGAAAARVPPPRWPGVTVTAPREVPPPSRDMRFRAAAQLALSAMVLWFLMGHELYAVLRAAWTGVFYGGDAFLAASAAATVVTVMAISMISTHAQLCAEDYNWWWRSFHRGGSAGAGLAVTAALFRAIYLPDTHGVGLLLYTAYMAFAAAGVYFCLGGVSFAASLAFVHFAFSRLNAAGCGAQDTSELVEQLLQGHAEKGGDDDGESDGPGERV